MQPDRIRSVHVGAESLATQPGGLNRYLAALIRALADYGSEPVGVVLGPGDGSLIIGVCEPSRPIPVRLWAVYEWIRRHASDGDLLDIHFALYGLAALPVTMHGLPSVVHFHGPWADESRVARGDGSLRSSLKAALERKVYQHADVVVVLSQAFGRLVIDRYGVDPDDVVVIPPGVDLDLFTPGDRDAARAELGLPSRAFVAVAVRRLERRMGLDVLLQSWSAISAEHPDAVLVIVGDGRERASLEKLRAQLSSPASVRFLGNVDDQKLVQCYRAADCSVVPTRALEGFGLVTLESTACGTPAIVTDVGGLPDGVIGLDPSLVVPADDQEALAQRLLAAANGDLPERLACRRHAEQFSWEEVARRHAELYARVSRPRVRVAYLGHTGVLSGAELALARIIPALEDVEPLVVLAEDGPLVARLRADGIPVEVMPLPERTARLRRDRVRGTHLPVITVMDSLRYAWRLRGRLREAQVDVVHTNTLKAALYGGLAGRLARVPVIWHVHDRIAPDYLPAAAVAIVRVLARVLPSAIIVASRATAATLGRCRTTVIPYALEADAGSGDTALPGASVPDEDQSVPESRPFTVGLVGRLAPWKGQDLFLRAFAAAFPSGDARARIVGASLFGEDGWANRLPILAVSLGIGDRVDFVGFADDMAREYARIDVLVHASTVPEPFGQVVVEAMAAGVPVVAADAGGPAEVVTSGVDGILYPMGDVGTLAGALRHLAADPALRAELVVQGRRRVEDYAMERIAPQVMEVYRSASARRRPDWSRR